MTRLIRDGVVVQDIDRHENLPNLEQWLQSGGSAVQLEPGETPQALLQGLEQLSLVAINFPIFTDGRGFSYARELRENGYKGEIRAVGNFIRDQLFYLQRCGFNAFEFASAIDLDAALASLEDFGDAYQAAPDQPKPLFRRRA